jgi:recombination protein RecR
LCVVAAPKTIFLIEKLGTFRGKYHVLNGLISPIDGINPEDIKLDKLIDRIKKENFKEIILAVKPSIEGETTSLYIKTILDGMDLKVSRIASGIPLGADIEYIDSLTLERAINERREIS